MLLKVFEIISENHDEIYCELCILAKQLNVKNKKTVIKANNPLEVIYSEIPVDPIGIDGFKYVINFVDEYSGCTFCYCYKQKSDIVKATKNLITDIATSEKLKSFK